MTSLVKTAVNSLNLFCERATQMGYSARRNHGDVSPSHYICNHCTDIPFNFSFLVWAAGSAISTFLSQVQSKESDDGTAAPLIKRDHEE